MAGQGSPDVVGMTSDPDFLSLPGEQKRDALFRLTKDASFKSLSNNDTERFISTIRVSSGNTNQPVSPAEQQAEEGTQIPKYYGFTPSNIGKNILQFGKNIGGMAKDVIQATGVPTFAPGSQTPLSRTPIFEGPNSLKEKYVTGPMKSQYEQGVKEESSGNKIVGRTNQALSAIPMAGPLVGSLIEQAGKGDVGGMITNAALNYATMRGPKDLPEEAQAGTVGMAKGGAAAEIERLANRIPIVSGPLKAKYAQVTDSFRSAVADSVEKAANIKADPSDVVGSLGKGVESLDTQAKAMYKPVDEYVAKNSTGLVSQLVQTLSADPDKLRELPPQTYQNPISGLKQFRDKLTGKGESLQRGGKGSEAFDYFRQADNVQQVLDKVTSTLPDDVKGQYLKAQATYGRARAMEDIQEIFGKQASGLPPAKQAAGTFKRPVDFGGQQMVKELTDSQGRLSQAFDPETAKGIIDHADRMGVAQNIRGGGGGRAIGGMMLGTGMLLQAFRGNLASIGPELGGMWILSKVLATPEAMPLYRNMLRSESVAQQQYWARQAVLKATGDKGPEQ